MKKKLFLLFILLIPFVVKGQTLVYNVCETGCEYNDINDVYTDIFALPTNVTHDITINIKDGREYRMTENSCRYHYVNAKVRMIGTTNEQPTLLGALDSLGYPSSYESPQLNTKDSYYENIAFKSRDYINFTNEGTDDKVTLKNVTIDVGNLYLLTKNIEMIDTTLKGRTVRIFEDNSYIHMKNVVGDMETLELESDHYLIEDSTFNHAELRTIKNGKNGLLKNNTVNGYIHNRAQINIEKTTINGQFISDNNDFTIKDTTINSENMDYAIMINRPNCGISNNTTNGALIDNVIIKGNPIYGLYASGVDTNYKIDINNVDFSNPTCSAYIKVIKPAVCPGSFNPTDRITPTFLANKYENANFHFTNSKVNCGQTSSDSTTIDAGIIYFEDSNNWTRPIDRGTDLEKNNVVELNNGRVYIDLSNKGTLKLNVDKQKPLIEYFKDLVPENAVIGAWIVEDESILKIVDNKIVPLKVGTTTITASIGDNNYILYINITDEDLKPANDQKNPKTADVAIIAILLLSIATLLIILVEGSKMKSIIKR